MNITLLLLLCSLGIIWALPSSREPRQHITIANANWIHLRDDAQLIKDSARKRRRDVVRNPTKVHFNVDLIRNTVNRLDKSLQPGYKELVRSIDYYIDIGVALPDREDVVVQLENVRGVYHRKEQGRELLWRRLFKLEIVHQSDRDAYDPWFNKHWEAVVPKNTNDYFEKVVLNGPPQIYHDEPLPPSILDNITNSKAQKEIKSLSESEPKMPSEKVSTIQPGGNGLASGDQVCPE